MTLTDLFGARPPEEALIELFLHLLDTRALAADALAKPLARVLAERTTVARRYALAVAFRKAAADLQSGDLTHASQVLAEIVLSIKP